MSTDILVSINQVINSSWFVYLPMDAKVALQGAATEITNLRAAQPPPLTDLEARITALETAVNAKLSIE